MAKLFYKKYKIEHLIFIISNYPHYIIEFSLLILRLSEIIWSHYSTLLLMKTQNYIFLINHCLLLASAKRLLGLFLFWSHQIITQVTNNKQQQQLLLSVTINALYHKRSNLVHLLINVEVFIFSVIIFQIFYETNYCYNKLVHLYNLQYTINHI